MPERSLSRSPFGAFAALGLLLVIVAGCGGSGVTSSGGSSSPSPPPPPSPPSFSLSVQPGNTNLVPGSSVQVLITEVPSNGFSGTVSVNVESVPSGVTFSPSLPQDIGPNGLTVLVSAATNTTMGDYSVTLVGSSGDSQFTGTLGIDVVAPTAGTIPGNRTNWVRLGSNPIAAYYDAPRNHVLASLPAMNRIEVIDVGTGNIVSSIPVSLAGNEPNGSWLASSSNISTSIDGNYLLALGVGHVAKISLASGQVVLQEALPSSTFGPIFPTFIAAAAGGHMIFGSWGGSAFYNWDGMSGSASLHQISDLYSFDRSFDGTKVLVASGDTSGAYQLLDVATDTIVAQGAYSNATIMTVRGNPVRDEWAVANSNGIDFFDSGLNLIASVPENLVGSNTYWGMTYSSDGQYLYFVYAPGGGLPFLFTISTATHSVVSVAPATGTDIAYFERIPPEWVEQPFAADGTGLVFGLGEKGLVIDDSTYPVDPSQATDSDGAIIATPDNGPVNVATAVQITTQTYTSQPDVWFGSQRALLEGLNGSGQVSATAPTAQAAGPVNIKLFPRDGYAHVMPQAYTYGTIITSLANAVCATDGGCSLNIFGFGLFGGSGPGQVTIGGNSATVQSTHYFNGDEPYPYPLQYVTVTVPPGSAGRADVSITSSSGEATLPGNFVYAASLQSYPSSQTYNALLFDEKRGILYAATDTEIARFSVTSSSFLSPITPPSLTGQTQFQGMCLTPDGSRLVVADTPDSSVAVIDPDNPSNAQVVAMPQGSSTAPGGPLFVAATSTGKVLISMTALVDSVWSGPLLELDLSTMNVQTLPIAPLILTDGLKLSSTSQGDEILIGASGIWQASTGQFTPISDNLPGTGSSAAAGDGNIFAIGDGFIDPDGTSAIGIAIPDELGGIDSLFTNDAALNDSGSLEFLPSQKNLYIIDTHHGDVLENVLLPNQTNIRTKVIAVDANAQHVFVADSQGLTVLTLAAAPLAVGSVAPSDVSAGGGTVATIRGSGFGPATTVTIAGLATTTSFVDPNTLQVTVPAGSAGAAQMVVSNPDGESYTLDDAVTYQ